MQSEEPVQVEDVVARNVDAGTHRVISALAMRHDNVQAIRSPALKNYDQPLGARAKFDRPKRSTCQKAWHSGRAHNCQSAIAKKYATSDAHHRLQVSVFGDRLAISCQPPAASSSSLKFWRA